MKQRLCLLTMVALVCGLVAACTAGRSSGGAGSPARSQVTAAGAGPAAAVASVRTFYNRYVAARQLGQGQAEAVVRSQVASWYLPILNATPGRVADRVECGLAGVPDHWMVKQAAVLDGQAVMEIGSRSPGGGQELWIVLTMDRGTREITGITCAIGGVTVTRAGATAATTSLYSYYLAARRDGASPRAVLGRLLEGGPTAGSFYLQQVKDTLAGQELGYDPLTCAAAAVPEVSAGRATIVAGGSVGLVVASAKHVQAVVTIVLSAKGWTVGSIACARPMGIT